MKITLFTSNKNRHNYLVNCLEKICEKLFVIQEFSPKIDNIIPTRYPSSEIMKEYFSRDKISFYLMVPYLVWSSYALILNSSIFLLN